MSLLYYSHCTLRLSFYYSHLKRFFTSAGLNEFYFTSRRNCDTKIDAGVRISQVAHMHESCHTYECDCTSFSRKLCTHTHTDTHAHRHRHRSTDTQTHRRTDTPTQIHNVIAFLPANPQQQQAKMWVYPYWYHHVSTCECSKETYVYQKET